MQRCLRTLRVGLWLQFSLVTSVVNEGWEERRPGLKEVEIAQFFVQPVQLGRDTQKDHRQGGTLEAGNLVKS